MSQTARATATVRGRRPYTPRMPAGQRREQILDAALHIIVRDGYRAVSIDAIARELDVTRPVVYNIFDGLEPLLFALLDRQEARALDQLMATITSAPDLADLGAYVRRAVGQLVAMVDADPATWTPILLAAVDTPDVVRGRIDRDRRVVRERIEGLIAAGFGARGPRGTVDASILAHAFLALAEYFGRLLLQDRAAVDVDALAATIATVVAAS